MNISGKLVRGTFFGALLILIISGIITYKTTESLSESSDELIKTYVVNIELEQIMSYLKDAETGRRGFLITSDSLYLEPYLKSRSKINSSLAQLKELAKDDDFQRDKLRELSFLIDIRLRNFREADQFRKEKELDSKAFDKEFLEGKKSMDDIRFKIDEMIAHENSELANKTNLLKQNVSLTPNLLLILIIVCILIILTAYFKISNDLDQLKKKNQELELFKTSRNQSEKISKNGTWIWDIENDKYTYSDNLYRLLGEEPNSFEPSIENFRKFVHPDDIAVLDDDVEEMKLKEDLPFITFRVLHKNGDIKHLKGFAEPFMLGGKKQLIGTTSDVTEQVEYYRVLEERNQELIRNNEELSAFNHIASHDLQEPLRKIQTFLSRLVDKEEKNISEKSHIYVNKIQSAAARMRLLIDDLLQFSRANKSEKIYETFNINELYNNAISNLQDSIEASNAEIIADTFPEMNVIPFQIQQLFENLVGNSLKYKKENETPKIKVTYKKVKKNKEKRLSDSLNTVYHKFTIEDNGIGFSNEYKHKIFDLFNRLHNKGEYSGSGIGLAICKKIVDNHKGYIFASGEVGKGATFEVFLPL